MLRTDIKLFQKVKGENISLMIGSERTITHVGPLLNIPTLYVSEDDTKTTPENYITYPFATKVLLPEYCDRGLWQNKRVSYKGYHESTFLHPQYFTPDIERVKVFHPSMERYFIVRLVSLTASHDFGKKGLSYDLLDQLISVLKKYGKVFITSENPLHDKWESYRLAITPEDIFHVLHYADLYVGDSQSMAMESAVLGTPSVRYNDFVGVTSVLNECDKHQLSRGFKTDQPQEFLKAIEEMVQDKSLKQKCRANKTKMLEQHEDVVDFFVNEIKRYAKT